MAYEGSVELISGIKTKNNGTFPLVDAPDVRINDSTRLSDFVQSIGDQTGAPNGFATLDQNGKVPSIQLPSYVDDVLEYDNQASFPSTGENGKIYVAKDTNKTYRWSGSGYVVISETLALGETSSTAYRGDRGKTAYNHASAKGSAFASGLYKITTNDQGHVTAATAAGNTDIAPLVIDDNATGVPATTKTWSAQKSSNELAKKVNDADLFAGIDIYDPNSASQGQFTFNADAYAHQAGTKYIVHNTGDGVYVTPPESLENACLSYERYTLTEYIQHIADNTIDDAAGDGDTGKTWSADKIYDKLALKANYTDVFAGCTEYVPVHRASFHTNAWYHEQGTAYICRLKSDDPDLAIVLVGPTHSVPGGETVELPYHLPTVETSTFYVYSLVDYIDSKASKKYVDEMVSAELAIEVETHTSTSGDVYVDTPFDPGDILLINGEYRKAIKRCTGGIYIQSVIDGYTVSITSKEMNADSYEKVQVLDDIDSYKEGFPFYSGILLIKDTSFVAVHRCVVTNRVEQARAQLTSWGFPNTSSAYKTMEAFYAQKPTPEHLILSCHPVSETETQALQAYMTMFGGYSGMQTDFYTVLVGDSMTGMRSLELANYVESMGKACVVFIPVIGDVSSVTASGNLADQIYQANLKRTFVFHLSDISECGAVAGFAIATLRSKSLQFIEGTPKGITSIEYSGSDTSDLTALACNYIYGGINPGSSRKKQFWALADEDMKAHTLYAPASITIGSTTITESQLQQLLALLN